MINKKNKSIIFVTISLLCIVLSIAVYILEKSGGSCSFLVTVFKRWHLKETVDIVAILSGISGSQYSDFESWSSKRIFSAGRCERTHRSQEEFISKV